MPAEKTSRLEATSSESFAKSVIDGVKRYFECSKNPEAYFEQYGTEIVAGIKQLLEKKTLQIETTETKQDPTIALLVPMHRRDKTFIWLLHQISRQHGSLAAIELVINGNPKTDDQLSIDMVRSICHQTGIELTEKEEALGVSGGRAYGLSQLPHGEAEVVVTLDCDTGPFSKDWLELIRAEFKNNPSLGVLYLPHAFPTKKGLIHKLITIPGQITYTMIRKQAHATGPAAAFRAKALEGAIDTQSFNAYSEQSLRDIVVGNRFAAANIYSPPSWSLTDGSRFSFKYLAVVIAQRMPFSIADWGNRMYNLFYENRPTQ